MLVSETGLRLLEERINKGGEDVILISWSYLFKLMATYPGVINSWEAGRRQAEVLKVHKRENF